MSAPCGPEASAAGRGTVSATTSACDPTTSAFLVAADSTGLAAAPAAALPAASSSGPADGSVSKVMIGEPTSTVSPAWWWISVTTPAYGEGTSTAALAVSTSTM